MKRKHSGRYRDWTQPWSSQHGTPETLSPEALRTLQEAGRRVSDQDADRQAQTSPVLEKRRERWLKVRVHREAPDVRSLETRADALRYFSQTFRDKVDVNDARLIRTFIWQFVVRVLAGQERPIRGNLRSVWYRELRSILLRLGLLHPEDVPADPEAAQCRISVGRRIASRPLGTDRGRYLLDLLEDAFQEMFLAGFFRYQDLQVYDARENFWSVGRNRGNIIMFTEKEGLFWLCKELQARFDVTILASRGSPIWITVDYLSQVLRRRDYSNLRLVCLTDYDPWGDDIARQAHEKFSDPVNGFRKVSLKVLTQLNLFTEERLHKSKRYLLAGHESPDDPVRTVVESWVKRTGGIAGEPYGIHVDHAEPYLITQAFERWLKEESLVGSSRRRKHLRMKP